MRARAPPADLRPVRLCDVFDNCQAAASADLTDGLHVRHLTVQVHRQDGARAGRDRPLDRRRVEGVAARIDVGEDGYAARADDCGGGVAGGQRGGDYFVARARAHGARGDEREGQRVRAAVDAGRTTHPTEVRPFGLESLHLGAKDVRPAAKDPRHRDRDLGFYLRVLST